ncbi:MAG: hypothetical protein ACLR2G_02300 [Phascolarctobacterium faecium]
MLELINSILSMSKIESGKVILTDDELSLAAAAGGCTKYHPPDGR